MVFTPLTPEEIDALPGNNRNILRALANVVHRLEQVRRNLRQLREGRTGWDEDHSQ